MAANIHRELLKQGYELNLGGSSFLRERTRYIGVLYDEATRAKCREAKGDTGWATTLAIPDTLEPVALTQFFPVLYEYRFFISLLRFDEDFPRSYGFEQAFGPYGMKQEVISLRRHKDFGKLVEPALWYEKPSECGYIRNPLCRMVWGNSLISPGTFNAVLSSDPLMQAIPTLQDAISSLDYFARPYPALPSKKKPASNPLSDLMVGGYEYQEMLTLLRKRMGSRVDANNFSEESLKSAIEKAAAQVASSVEVLRQIAFSDPRYTTIVTPSSFQFQFKDNFEFKKFIPSESNPPAPKLPPELPRPKSGRMIILDDED